MCHASVSDLSGVTAVELEMTAVELVITAVELDMTAVELVEIAVEIVMTAAMFGVPAAMLSHDFLQYNMGKKFPLEPNHPNYVHLMVKSR